jgi:hypothetical protein
VWSTGQSSCLQNGDVLCFLLHCLSSYAVFSSNYLRSVLSAPPLSVLFTFFLFILFNPLLSSGIGLNRPRISQSQQLICMTRGAHVSPRSPLPGTEATCRLISDDKALRYTRPECDSKLQPWMSTCWLRH